MATFSYLFPLLTLLLLISPTPIIPPAAAIGAPEISAICEKSVNRAFCAKFLQTTPGVSAADLAGAGGIVLDVSGKKAEDTERYVKALLGKTTDPGLKEAYGTCAESYDDAVGDIADAKDSLGSGDYGGANIRASAAQTATGDCGDAVKGTAAPGEIGDRNEYLFNVLDIVLIIANKLKG